MRPIFSSTPYSAVTARKLGALSLCILTIVNIFWFCVYFDLHQTTVRYFNLVNATSSTNATTQVVAKDLSSFVWTSCRDYIQCLLRPYHRLPFPVQNVTSDLLVAPSVIAACQGGLKTLFFIHTAPTHWAHRAVLRRYLGRRGLNRTLVFFVGLSSDADVSNNVSAEATMHGDVVVLPYLDAYRNLTYKFVYGIKWTVDNCPNVEQVIKMDDDIVVNVHRLDAYLSDSFGKNPDAFHCMTWHGMKVIREKNSPWYLSKEMYPKDTFPAYCSGSAMVLPTGKLRSLYLASFFVPFIPVDDAYVSGELAAVAHVAHVEINGEYTLQENAKKVAQGTIIFAHFYQEKTRLDMWRNMQIPERGAPVKASNETSAA